MCLQSGSYAFKSIDFAVVSRKPLAFEVCVVHCCLQSCVNDYSDDNDMCRCVVSYSETFFLSDVFVVSAILLLQLPRVFTIKKDNPMRHIIPLELAGWVFAEHVSRLVYPHPFVVMSVFQCAPRSCSFAEMVPRYAY